MQDKRLQTFDCYMTYDALEAQTFAVRALRTSADLPADPTFALQLDTLLYVERRCAQVFQDLCSAVQKLPPVQRLGIRLLITVVQRCVLLIEQPAHN